MEKQVFTPDETPNSAAEKLNKLHADVQDLTKHKSATEEEVQKIAASFSELKKQFDEEAEVAAQALDLAKRAAATLPGDKGEIDGAKFAALIRPVPADEELLKLTKSSRLDENYVGLMSTTESDLRRRGASDADVALWREFSQLNDELFYENAMRSLKEPGTYVARGGMQSLRKWGRFQELAKRFQGALGTGSATAGLNWVPTILSGNLIELVQVQMRLANFFQRFPMTSLTNEVTTEGTDNIAYLISDGTSITASDTTTTKMTLAAVKLAGFTTESWELDQDSIVAMVPEINRKLAKAIRRAIENAIVNGQKTADIDLPAPAATDARKAWDGIRYGYSLTGATPTDAGAGLTAEQMANLKGSMGAYGIDPSELIWVCSPWGYAKLLTLKDSANNAVVLTADKMGGDSTFQRGQLGSAFGSPIVVSEFVPETLNASGVIPSPAGTKTAIYCVNTSNYRLGERLGIAVEASPHVNFQNYQVSFRAVWRGDFKAARTPSSSIKSVAAIGNIATS